MGEDENGLLHLGKLWKRRPNFFQVYLNLYEGVLMLRNHLCFWYSRNFGKKIVSLPIWRLKLTKIQIK